MNLKIVNEDTGAGAQVLAFENGNPFGAPIPIPPGESTVVSVTSGRKFVLTLAGATADDVPHATVPTAVSPSGRPMPAPFESDPTKRPRHP